ncbi:MAG: ABC transporter substrate-binding protein [Chloroflexota bacterium]
MKKYPIILILVPILLGGCGQKAQTAADCTADQRLFTSETLASGSICIPKDPQRIAFIDELVGVAPAIGVETVTRSVYFDLLTDDFPNTFTESEIDAMMDLGHPRSINSENMVLAEPDLIISNSGWRRANRQITSVAPTVIWNYSEELEPHDYFRAIGEVLNRSDEVEVAIAELDGRMVALQAEVGETNETFSVVRTMEETGEIQVFTTNNFGATLTTQLGLTMPDEILTPEQASRAQNAWWYPLSVEELDQIDADHIFLLRGWEPDVQEEFLANPLWQTLSAVQNDQVHFIDGEYWVRTHPLSQHRIIDDLFLHVAEIDLADVAPNPYAWTYKE